MVETTVVSQAVLFAAAVALLWFALRTYRTQGKPVGRWFGGLLGLLGVTAFCIGTTGAMGTANKLVWLVTNLSIPVFLLAFSLGYYGIAVFTSRARLATVLTPAVVGLVGGTLVILGTPAKTPGTDAPLDAVGALPGWVFDVATVFNRIGFYYTAGLVILAVGLVVLNVVRYEHLDTRLAVLIAFVGAWPWLGNFLVPELGSVFGDVAALAVLSTGYATSAAVAGLVLGPLGLFDSSPAAGNVGPERVLDSMDDAVLIADDSGHVLRLNTVACETFGFTEQAAIGRHLSELIGTAPEDLDTATTDLETTAGVRQFDVTCSPVRDGNGFERGTVFVLRDVTQRRTREQRLQVLNRVLRHNLRNDASSIIGRAELISSGQETEEAADRIIETTRDLVGVAETARDIEAMMGTATAQDGTPLRPLVEGILEDIEREYPAVEVTTAVPASGTAAVSTHVLETVLFHLLENAAEHNDAEEPIVVVSADDTDGDSLTIAISDNGPGIPEHERAVLDAGEEGQLEHGSGLGLWAVNWGIAQMGGKLSISDAEPRGTTVSVTVPADGGASPVDSPESEESNTTSAA